nr:transposase, mutator type [Tanacetum cinerariifolium]
MANLSKDIQCAGFDTRPPMFDRTDITSWKQRIRLYCRGKKNGVNILKSIDEGAYQIGTVREPLAEGIEGAPQLGPERPRVYSDLNQATIQDGRVVVQNVQGRQNRGQGMNPQGGGAAEYGGVQNRVGNANMGQARQGIIPAFGIAFPRAKHRLCFKHLHENIKLQWRGGFYKKLLWKAATATTIIEFEKKIKEIKAYSVGAYEYLNKISLEQWSRSHFRSNKYITTSQGAGSSQVARPTAVSNPSAMSSQGVGSNHDARTSQGVGTSGTPKKD